MLTLIIALVVVMTLEDLENVSEVQVDEEIIPAIADLGVPLVMGSRLAKLIKATQKAARASWDQMSSTRCGERKLHGSRLFASL